MKQASTVLRSTLRASLRRQRSFSSIKVSPILLSRKDIERASKMSLATCAYTSGNVSEWVPDPRTLTLARCPCRLVSYTIGSLTSTSWYSRSALHLHGNVVYVLLWEFRGQLGLQQPSHRKSIRLLLQRWVRANGSYRDAFVVRSCLSG